MKIIHPKTIIDLPGRQKGQENIKLIDYKFTDVP